MQISLFKHRHVLEKLKKENSELHIENLKLQEKIETMKLIMLEFDHQRLADVEAENVCD
jgi:hypothetical protein